MIVDVATFKVRPALDPDGPTAWVAIAHYESDGEKWSTVGAGTTESDALIDLNAQLPREVEACSVIPASTTAGRDKRKILLWSAKSRALMAGTPIVQVA